MPFLPAPQPCWLIEQEGDWLGCGRDWNLAVWLSVRVWGDELAAGAQTVGPPVIRRADGLCVQLLCEACGRWLADPETLAPLHGMSRDDVLGLASEYGWMGERCPGCQDAPYPLC
ncbi:hypothetical protein GA0070563_11256 [Micromonospora carbonacea]|uniref:Uncharacterized protein n=1 Tax=Micromonospora carbonacea TaxID=47853 RepID=A0A1C5AAI4_9ACTN|nr:hypothetical protein GA0070563_11256 [Micromonospora carbonacea]